MAIMNTEKKLFLLLLLVVSIVTFHLSVYLRSETLVIFAHEYPNFRNGGHSRTRKIDHNAHCRAMFTLTDAIDHNFIPYPLSMDPDWYMKKSVIVKATRQLQIINKKRNNGTGPDTEDYRELARLLPQLLYVDIKTEQAISRNNLRFDYHNESHSLEPLVNFLQFSQPETIAALLRNASESGKTTQKSQIFHSNEQNSSITTPRMTDNIKVLSRFQSTRGILPYIPCRIIQHSQRSVDFCLRKRLSENSKLTIFFLGDSKVRNIWGSLLNLTNRFKYMLTYGNTTEPWHVLKGKMNDEFKHNDFDAVSSVYPNLRISMRFRRFWNLMYLDISSEVLLLKEWVEGVKPVPDLVIVGYSSWLLYLHFGRPDYRTNVPQDVMDLFYTLHKKIIPLLEALALKTKVLVHADPRLKPYSKADKPRDLWLKNVIFHDALLDWSELLFWHFLQKDDNPKQHPYHNSLLMSVSREPILHAFKMYHNDSFSNEQLSTDHFKTPKVPLSKNFERRGPIALSQGESHQELTKTLPTDTKDHLKNVGLWWWDSSLVLNLATILECNELHHLNMTHHPIYNSFEMKCADHHHSSSATLEFEAQMLFNLICNSFTKTNSFNCCS